MQSGFYHPSSRSDVYITCQHFVRMSMLLITDVPTLTALMAQESLKSVIAQYNASQLLTMREVGTYQDNHSATASSRKF